MTVKARGLGRWTVGRCCGCGGERPCAPEACFKLAAPCLAADKVGVTIAMQLLDEDGLPVGDPVEGVTDSDGELCLELPEPGMYDVTAEKAGCRVAFEWESPVEVGCSKATFEGRARCGGRGGVEIAVFGCHGLPLPGAVVTLTPVPGQPGAPSSGATGSGGTGVFYPDPGVYKAAVSHPSGRFAPLALAPTYTVTECGAPHSIGGALEPAAAYVCCNPAFNSPYPISRTLYVTDAGGTVPLTGACGGTACANRTMDRVSIETGPLGPCSPVPRSCAPASGSRDRPPTLGSAMSRVNYLVDLAGTPFASQSIPSNTTYLFLFDPFPGPCDVPVAQKLRHRWRCPTPCGSSTAEAMTFGSAGFTLNSAMPFNATFTFAPGGSWTTGPTGAPTGEPYSLSIVVHE